MCSTPPAGSTSYRVKSGIFGQRAKFRQPACLFHSSIIGIKNKLTKQKVKILMRRLIRSRLIWISTVCKRVSEFTSCPNLPDFTLEAEIHKRQLSMLYNIQASTYTNETITELTEQQIAINIDHSLSYNNKVQKVLSKYQLPTLNELRIKQPTKESWTSTVKEAVNKYRTESLKNEAYEKSSHRYLNIDSMKLRETHSVWKSLDSIVSDVRRGTTIMCRILTGRYWP